MLSSTHEYFKALHEGQYLQFLEWPGFVVSSYAANGMNQDADNMADLLFLEWLNAGFEEEDAKKIAILYAVYEKESSPVTGKLAYALMSIVAALLQCLTYKAKKMDLDFIITKKMNTIQILSWIKKQSELLNMTEFSDCLQKQQGLFFSWVRDCDGVKISEAQKHMAPLVGMRLLLESYMMQFGLAKPNHSELDLTRMSLVSGLFSFLEKQVMLNETTQQEIAGYVEKIRGMQPEKWEEEYLNQLAPLSFIDSGWKFMVRFGMTLFQYIDTPKKPKSSEENNPSFKH